jgi:hypothetical protein
MYLDEEFGRALHCGEFQYASYQVTERRDDANGVMLRRIEYTPKVSLPEPAVKVVGDGSYSEQGRYDPATGYSAQLTLKKGAKSFTTRFEIQAEPIAERRCEMIQTIDNKASILGVGGLVERMVEQAQRRTQVQVAAFIRGWIEKHQL